MRYINSVITTAMIAPLLAACIVVTDTDGPIDHDTTIIGSGRVITEARPVSGFVSLSIGGVARLFVEQTDTESLTITAEDNVLPHLMSDVTDGRLILGPEENLNFENVAEIVYRLTVKSLSDIAISGVIIADATGIDTDVLDVITSGVSTLRISGNVRRQNVVVSGVSTYDAGDLVSEEATINGSGVFTVILRVSEQLGGDVCGAGSVEYMGDPQVTLNACPGILVSKR